MEPITLAIIGALANLSQAVIKDSYEGVKGLIVKKYGGDSKVSQAVDELQDSPKSPARQAVLNEEIVAAKAHHDLELKSLVDDLLAKLKTIPGAGTTVTQNITGNRNIVTGIGSTNVNEK